MRAASAHPQELRLEELSASEKKEAEQEENKEEECEDEESAPLEVALGRKRKRASPRDGSAKLVKELDAGIAARGPRSAVPAAEREPSAVSVTGVTPSALVEPSAESTVGVAPPPASRPCLMSAMPM